MKLSRRIISIVLAVFIFTASINPAVFAEENILTLPEQLQIIDVEAFCGLYMIDNVVLSNHVREIRERAFAGSSLSEINLPGSLTFISPDAFDGPQKVSVTATPGTYAYQWAIENGYLKEPVEVSGIYVSQYYLSLNVGDTYQLTASVYPANADDPEITWTSNDLQTAIVDENGVVAAVGEGTAVISASSSNQLYESCTVDVNQKADTPAIISYSQNGNGDVTITWTGIGEGYQYFIYENTGTENRLIGTTSASSYTFTAPSAGMHNYFIQSGVRNQRGVWVTSDYSDEIAVDVQYIWSFDAEITGIEQTGAGSILIRWHGTTPADAYEIAEYVNNAYQIVLDNLTSDSAALDAVGAGVHRYAIRTRYEDTQGQSWISAWSPMKSVTVFSADEYAPAAPVLIFDDPEMAFSSTEDSAPEYIPNDIPVSWEPVPEASSYSVTVEKKTGDQYILVDEELNISRNSYEISENKFDDISETTLFRFGIRSIGFAAGEPAYSYFAVGLPDESITVDGAVNVSWSRPSQTAGSRTFTVASALSWTAECSVEWLSAARQDDSLILSITDDNYSDTIRTGMVRVTNGVNTAEISVRQAYESKAPILSYLGEELSKDANAPTVVPYGAEFGIEKNPNMWTIVSRCYEDDGLSWKTVIARTKGSVIQIENALAGEELTLEVFGSLSNSGAGENAADRISQNYYIKIKDDLQYIRINGQTAISDQIDSEEDKDYAIEASNAWSASADEDWLTVFTYTDSIRVRPEINYSGSERTGHITVTCGDQTAVLTVIQPDMTPRLTFPEHMSQSALSPTSFGAGTLTISWIGVYADCDRKNGNNWVDLWSASSSTYGRIEKNVSVLPNDLLETGQTYRLTIKDNADPEHSNVYYFKKSSSGTGSIIIDSGNENVETAVFDETSAAFSVPLTFTSSGTWTASSSEPSWLTVSPAFGTAKLSDTITISGTANTGAKRSGVVSLKIGSVVYATVFVNQEAGYGDYVHLQLEEQENRYQHISGADGAYVKIKAFFPGTGEITPVSNENWISSSSGISGETFYIDLAKNTTGARRSGTITFAYGSASQTVTLTQEPCLDTPVMITSLIPGTRTEPAYYTYDTAPTSLVISSVADASAYRVILKSFQKTLPMVYGGNFRTVYSRTIPDTGASQITFSIPAAIYDETFNGEYELSITALDAYGNANEPIDYWFVAGSGNVVLINGKVQATWVDVNDIGDSKDFRIGSPDTWTADVSDNWISLSSLSGESGDSFSVTVARNTGSARTGTVTVSSGSVTAVLTVRQCAVLSEYPEFHADVLNSRDITSPTFFSDTGTKILRWNSEPQASYYQVDLFQTENGSGTPLQTSGVLEDDNFYALDLTVLQQGKIYAVDLTRVALRTNGYETTRSRYYFAVEPSNPYLKLTGNGAFGTDASVLNLKQRTFYANDEEGYTSYAVDSSGTWVAVSGDPDWLMVGKRPVDSDYLEEEGYVASDFEYVTGNSGETLYISVLQNDTGAFRRGSVRLSTAGTYVYLYVDQDQDYVLPKINSPVLGTSIKKSVEMPLDSITFRWNKGTGNNEEYDLYLEEKYNGSWLYVDQRSNITASSVTIPGSKLREDSQYRVWLGTRLLGSRRYVETRYYYFHTAAVHEMWASVDADWSLVNSGGHVLIYAYAGGGSGGYQYAYQLLLDGVKEQESTWLSSDQYSFTPRSSGSYSVKLIARDSSGTQRTAETASYEKEAANTISLIKSSEYAVTVGAGRQRLSYTILTDTIWSVFRYPDWISSPADIYAYQGNGTLDLTIQPNDGVKRSARLVISNNDGINSVLTVTQEGSRSVVMMAPTGVYTGEAQDIRVNFNTTASYTARVKNSSWAVMTEGSSGGSGENYSTIHLKENNTGSERTAVVSVACNGDTAEFTIRQQPRQAQTGNLSLSLPIWSVESSNPEQVVIRITTDGSWRISQRPSWVSANPTAGSGTTDITLFCTDNQDNAYRNGTITFTAGTQTQSISVSQPGGYSLPYIVDFDILNNTVYTGDRVSFEVNTKNATSVVLMIDGSEYDTFPVVNNKAEGSRTFWQGGSRKISFIPVRGEERGAVSGVRNLYVDYYDYLDTPDFTVDAGAGYTGEPVNIIIPKVNHAEFYNFWIYSPGDPAPVFSSVTEENLAAHDRTVTLDAADMMKAGDYRVLVIAAGSGYSQSEKADFFTLQDRNYSVSIIKPLDGDAHIPGENVDVAISQTGGGYAAIKVVPPSGNDNAIWCPSEGNHTTSASTYSCPVTVSESGTYSVYAYVFAADVPANRNKPKDEDSVIFTSNGPEIIKTRIHTLDELNTWVYESEADYLYVVTSDAADEVIIKDSKSSSPSDPVTPYKTADWQQYFKVPISDKTAGKHTIQVTAIDKNLTTPEYPDGVPSSAEYSFYIAVPVTPYTVYPVKREVMKSSPLNAVRSYSTIEAGPNYEPLTVTHDAGDWVYITRYTGEEGFVPLSSVSRTIPAGASGTVSIQFPYEGASVSRNSDGTVEIKWQGGIAVTSAPEVTAQLKNTLTNAAYSLKPNANDRLYIKSADVSGIPDGPYSLYLIVKDASGSNIQSETVNFILGSYSDDAYYKEWFSKNIYQDYSHYLSTMHIDRDTETIPYYREELRNAVLHLSGGWIYAGKYWWRLFNRDNRELSAYTLSSIDETQRKQLNLTVISNMVMEDIDKAEIELKEDLSNVNNATATIKSNRIIKEQAEEVFAVIDLTYDAIKLADKIAEIDSTVYMVPTLEKEGFAKYLDTIVDTSIKIFKSYTYGTIEKYSRKALIQAYKEQYTKAMKHACQEYVGYLKHTIFGDANKPTNQIDTSNLSEREEAALVYIKAYEDYIKSGSKIEQDAIASLLQYADDSITIEQLYNNDNILLASLKEQFSNPEPAIEIIIDAIAKEGIKKVCSTQNGNWTEQVRDNMIRDLYGILKAFLWDSTNHKTTMNFAAAQTKLEDFGKEYGIAVSFSWLIGLVSNQTYDLEYSLTGGSSIPSRVKEDHIKDHAAIIKSAISLCKTAWDTGNHLAGLFENMADIHKEKEGFSAFNMYSSYFVAAYRYGDTIIMDGNVYDYGWNYMSKLSISELERMRIGLITLMLCDEDVYSYYSSMRTVNEQADWLFEIVQTDPDDNEISRYTRDDYLDPDLIDQIQNMISVLKGRISNVPLSIQTVVSRN